MQGKNALRVERGLSLLKMHWVASIAPSLLAKVFTHLNFFTFSHATTKNLFNLL